MADMHNHEITDYSSLELEVLQEQLYKCGEVFLEQRESLIIICTVCQATFRDLIVFNNHIHVHIESEAAKEQLEVVRDHEEEEYYLIEPNVEQKLSKVEDQIAKSKFSCECCCEQFNNEKHFRQHKCSAVTDAVDEDVADAKVFQCSVCKKVFKRKWNLRIHEYSHSDLKPFACDVCPASYSNKQNLVVHKRRHSGVKPFKCDYCPRKFVSSTERHSHIRQHTGLRPFVCSECGRAYTTSSQLLEHRRRVHLDVRNYVCTDCGKHFRTRTNLNAHYDTVHAELPRSQECSLCQATFKTSSALYAHSKIHKEKNYKCSVCSKMFAQHPGLYAHMKTHKGKNEHE